MEEAPNVLAAGAVTEPVAVFELEWRRLSERHVGVIDTVDPGVVVDELRHGVALMFANLRWAAIVGDTFDTPTACSLLGVSRQALHRRLATGTLVGLPGESSTRWPAWQFERNASGAGSIRSIVPEIVRAFAEALGDDYGPHIVASWATAPNVDLGGLSPADWVIADRPRGTVLDAAHAAAFAESQ